MAPRILRIHSLVDGQTLGLLLVLSATDRAAVKRARVSECVWACVSVCPGQCLGVELPGRVSVCDRSLGCFPQRPCHLLFPPAQRGVRAAVARQPCQHLALPVFPGGGCPGGGAVTPLRGFGVHFPAD